MRQKLLIIKLGGAVVTYKDSPIPKARTHIVKRLAGQIKQIKDKDYQIILVHGAGSFAHGLVKKYDLHHGMKTIQQKEAYDKVIASLLRLNKIIMDNLTKAGLSSISLPPHTFITQSAGKLIDFDPKIVKKYLDKSIIPVLFGDLMIDDAWGCSVLSGDTIVCYLGQKLKPEKVIFLSDVDGVYSANPKNNPHAKLISEINNENLEQVLTGLSPTGRSDVTGEMNGKILEIKTNLKNIEVVITNGFRQSDLDSILLNSQSGTKIHLT